MKTVSLDEARTDLPSLVDRAARGEPFVIVREGKPIVKVVPIEPSLAKAPRRIGFLAGQISVPDDFDRMGQDEIERLFEGR